MKNFAKLWAPVLAVSALLVAGDLAAQSSPRGGRDGSGASGAHRGGEGRHGGRDRHDGRHGGRDRHDGRGYRGGHHHHGHWYGRGYWWPGYYAWGWPLFWGATWAWPRYDYYYYPRETVVYREVPAYPEGQVLPPTTEVPRTEGAPSRGPLYMNYCESAKAYFPKVTSCPEGWRLASPTG